MPTQSPADQDKSNKPISPAAPFWGYLLHLGYNLWGDWDNPVVPISHYARRPYLRCDSTLWDDLLPRLRDAGVNLLVIDLADGVRYAGRPEIAVERAWSTEELRVRLDAIRALGIEPIPKLNFSTCHDEWLGPYARQVSTPVYYEVCRDLIREVVDLFGGPRLFHLGMDEEDAAHQVWHEHVIIRQHGLWWRDLAFFCDQLPEGTRPWIWADYVWHHADEFFAKMPRSILQSNWYYGQSFDESIGYVRAYRQLEEHAYDQVPTGSPWEVETNFPDTVKFARAHIAPPRLKGFLQTVWRPTLEEFRGRHLEAIREVAAARQWFDQAG